MESTLWSIEEQIKHIQKPTEHLRYKIVKHYFLLYRIKRYLKQNEADAKKEKSETEAGTE